MLIEVKGHKIELYDDIDNLPIKRFNKFNKFLMKASDIGSTLSDYDIRTRSAIEFLDKKMISEAIQELNNRRQGVFNAYQEYSPTDNALAVLVKKIDGVEYKDFSTKGLDEILNKLDSIGLSRGKSLEYLKDVKKKSSFS